MEAQAMTIEQPPAVIPPTKSRLPLVLIVAAVLLLIAAGVGTYLYANRGSALAKSDPAGAAACRGLRDWINGDVKDPDTGKPYNPLLMAMSVSDVASKSTTPAIRDAVGENIMDDPELALLKSYGAPSEFRVADLRKVHAACAAAGEKMPAYAEPAS